MLSTTYVALFLVVHIIRSEATGFRSFYAINTNDCSKSSGHKISNIKSKSRCLGTCRNKMEKILMIRHDESTKTCICCNDNTGSDIVGQIGSHMPHIHVGIFFI